MQNATPSSSIAKEIEDLRPRYESALEALRHQQMVIDQLEDLLIHKTTPQPLSIDNAAQTEVGGDVPESLFVRTIKLRLELERARSQRAQAAKAQQFELAEMERDLTALRSDVVAALPVGVHVQPLLESTSGAAGGAAVGSVRMGANSQKKK